MPESKYSIGGIKNGISILFFIMKMEYPFRLSQRCSDTQMKIQH